METEARLLILEEPTIGVDVGAKAEIYHLLQLSLSSGLAVLLISSDFEEVERVCHRALVFSRGRVVAEIPRARLTVAALTQAASGGAEAERRGACVMKREASSPIGAALTRAISVWGLLILFVLLVIVFSLLKPDTFLTYFNIRSILSNKSVQLLVALSVFIPMVANQFDLSAGFNVGISQVLAIGLQGQGWPWQAAVAAVLADGRGGRARERAPGHAGEDRFLHRDAGHRNASSTGSTPGTPADSRCWPRCRRQFLAISGNLWIVPAPAIYALIVSLTLWVVFEYLPLGRYLYVLGREPARGRAQRHFGEALHYRSPSSRRERSRPSPASCCSLSFRSGRARSARNICCPPSPPRCSERPRCGPAGSMCGGRCSRSRCSR